MSQHLAAIIPSKGSDLVITKRPTPTPGPHEVVIDVKSIAVNPIDWYQRAVGFAIETYPAVVGSDIGGVITAVGDDVSPDLIPGTCVAAFAPCFYMKGAPDYGAFQERVLVPDHSVTSLPESIRFNEASLLGMAVLTSWAGYWHILGLPLRVDTAYPPEEKRGIVIWSGVSSIGSAGVQIAESLGLFTYVTASEKHHEYLKILGAHNTFNYRSSNVVQDIIKAAKEDGVTIQLGYLASGSTKDILEVIQGAKGEGVGKLASAIPLGPDTPTVNDIENRFIEAPNDAAERAEFSHFVFRVWLKEKLEKKKFVPSPGNSRNQAYWEGFGPSAADTKQDGKNTKPMGTHTKFLLPLLYSNPLFQLRLDF